MTEQMRYLRMFTFLFSYKDWANRVLMASLMFLIPLVGPIVVQGWALEVMHRRVRGEEGLPELNDFGGLLKKGLTPFLGYMISSFVMMFVMFVLYAIGFGVSFFVSI